MLAYAAARADAAGEDAKVVQPLLILGVADRTVSHEDDGLSGGMGTDRARAIGQDGGDDWMAVECARHADGDRAPHRTRGLSWIGGMTVVTRRPRRGAVAEPCDIFANAASSAGASARSPSRY